MSRQPRFLPSRADRRDDLGRPSTLVPLLYQGLQIGKVGKNGFGKGGCWGWEMNKEIVAARVQIAKTPSASGLFFISQDVFLLIWAVS